MAFKSNLDNLFNGYTKYEVEEDPPVSNKEGMDYTKFPGSLDLSGGPKPRRNDKPPESKAVAPNYIKIKDVRTLNPATGMPFKKAGQKSTQVDPAVLTAIISHAKAQGVDPYTAMAIGLQETNFGQLDPNIGSAWSYSADPGISDSLDQNANILAKAVRDKLQYAKKIGIDKRGEEYALQAYNGYGTLYPRGKTGGKYDNESYYEIPVTGDKPLNLKENPAYGKTVISLRDQLLKSNPEIQKLVAQTKPFK